MRFCLLVGLICLVSISAAQPVVHPDRTATIRLKAPNAKQVTLYLEGFDGAEMKKGEDGVWSYETPALQPDIYGYGFVVDGVGTADPANPVYKPNLIWAGSLLTIPGQSPELWEMQDVPHGVVHHHTYRSEATGAQEDYYIYTPPGYKASQNYPVLYLLHGYSDTAEGWIAVGKANLILDNLMAKEKAVPMIVVMPLGYGVPDFASANRGFSNKVLTLENYTRFRTALEQEIKPQVAREYKVDSSPARTAIAGLSMGGAETLFLGLEHLGRYAYVGSFSAGGWYETAAELASKVDAPGAIHSIKLLYISCGNKDDLMKSNRELAEDLLARGVKLAYYDVPNRRHEWPLWRRNLAQFVSMIFKK